MNRLHPADKDIFSTLITLPKLLVAFKFISYYLGSGEALDRELEGLVLGPAVLHPRCSCILLIEAFNLWGSVSHLWNCTGISALISEVLIRRNGNNVCKTCFVSHKVLCDWKALLLLSQLKNIFYINQNNLQTVLGISWTWHRVSQMNTRALPLERSPSFHMEPGGVGIYFLPAPSLYMLSYRHSPFFTTAFFIILSLFISTWKIIKEC